MTEKEQQSLENYKRKFEVEPDSFNEFQANDFILLLKNNNELDEAIEVSKTFLTQSPELKNYFNQYGYALYNKYINVSDEEIKSKEKIFFDIVDEIIDLCKQEKYSPVEPTINRVIKYALYKNPVDFDLIIKMYSKLDVSKISDKPFVNKAGKEYESRKERYFRILTRAYYETKNYRFCVELANLAFGSNLKWHFNTIHWIRYYRACSLVELKIYDEAQRDFIVLHNKIRGINFYEVLFKMHTDLNNPKLANAYLLYEFFEKGYSYENINLYIRLKEATDNTDDDKLKNVVDSFIKQLSIENNHDCDLNITEKHLDKSASELYDDMYEIIMSNLDKYVTRIKARVVYYNENKKLGNLSSKDKDGVFFRQSDYIYDEEIFHKDSVKYTLLPTYDKIKDRITEKAILIKTVEDNDIYYQY